MKIRVIKPFTDKMFNDEITRKIGEIIDTEDKSFRCDEELELVEEEKPAKAENKGKKEKNK